MNLASITKDILYKESGAAISVLFENDNTKEIRILMKAGQIMKEHKTSYPIVVEIFKGEIDFGINGEVHKLVSGDLIALEGGVPHDLKAKSDSIVRLSLSKKDSVERVFNLVK